MSVTDLSPEERCERVRMALAEVVDEPRVAMMRTRHHETIGLHQVDVDPEAFWRACALAGDAVACWPCVTERPHWRIDSMNGWLLGLPACDHDPLTSPWPPVDSGA